MTNETNRMKTKVGRIGSRGIAIVLCFVMLLTAIGSGSVLSAIAVEGNGASVLLDAAKAGADVDAVADVAAADDKAAADEDEAPLTKKADSDLADTGRDADISNVGVDYCYVYLSSDTSDTPFIKTNGGTENGWYKFGTKTGDKFNGKNVWRFELGTDSTSSCELAYRNSSNNDSGWTTIIPNGSSPYDYAKDKIYCDADSHWDDYKNKTRVIAGDTGLTGSNWSATAGAMTLNSDGFNTVTFSNKTFTTSGYNFCMINSGDWNWKCTNIGTCTGCTVTTYGSENNLHIDVPAAGTYNVTFYYNGHTNYIWASATPTTTLIYLTGYINGADVDTLTSTNKFTGTSSPYTFTITNSTTDTQYVTITNNSGTVYHPATHGAGSGTAYSTTNTDMRADPKWKVSGCKGKNITFTWDGSKLSWVVSSTGNIDVYAKDGAAPIDWDNKTSGGATGTSGTAYNYAIIATTSVTNSGGASFTTYNCGNSTSAYKYGSVAPGSTITVTTAIGSSYTSTYYVAGWCVNGITYKNGTDTVGVNTGSESSYSFTYTLPSDTEGMLEDVAGHPVVEITPIYYRKDKTNTVTFYIEGYSDVASKWGNTPYAYPFYGDLSGYQNTFGAYPGQPVVNVGGQMSIEIPIYSKAIYSKSNDGTTIKGVTVNNGYADHVHRNLVYGWTTGSNVNDDKDHMQTYDYDDFYKIYAERKDTNGDPPNAIFFRFKEETTKYNRSTYGGSSTSGQFASGTSSISISTINTSGNGWELLKDRHDRPVNIFGDYSAVSSVTPSSATADTSKAIYVVSTGYNANIAGDYGTMWKIYNGSGTLISTDSTNSRYGIPPSLLNLAGNASSGITSTVSYPSANRSVVGVGSYTDSNLKYNNIYKTLKSSYTGKLVYITYEKDTQDTRNVSTGEGAYRADGQWFYTFATDEVQSTIGIEYYNRSTGKWVADTVSAAGVGTTTKATAAFDTDSYLSSSSKTTSKEYLTSANGTWNFTATESGTDNKYAFSGWYLKYDDTYEQVTGSTTAGSIKASANYTLIARYVPVTTSSLVITHKLDPASTGTGSVTMTVKYNNTTQTVNYVNGVANAEINVSWATSAKNIDVTLTATPQNDGRVDSISVDDQISAYATNTTNYTLPCTTDGRAVTRTLRFTDHDVYNSAGTSLVIDQLDYVSVIEATPHYYEFTYTFTDRGGDTKNYTARGEISEDHYAEYVNSSHQVSDDFVKSRAPFESNFLQTLKLGSISGKNYDTSTHTLSATATYNATSYTPVYDVKIKLPYVYHDAAGGSGASAYKKYTAANDIYVTNTNTFTLKANYDEFVTIGATETTAGAQTKVSKVVDEAADPNHTGNDFITAPNTLSGGRYFRYWEIKRLADNDTDQAEAPVISRIYFPDLNYRFYADSYVEAVYTTDEDEYWSNVNKNQTNSELSCSVLYLESSRNQYNTVASGTSTSAANAADIIYNDFIFSYRLRDKENISSEDAEIGMIIERVKNSTGTAFVKGDSTVTNMDSYKAANSSTEDKTAIAAFAGGGTNPGGCVKQVWDNSTLNNKNYTEQNYYFYAQYGQTVADHSITFTKDSANDDYLYRAWAYIKDSDGNVAVSDPAYFSMNYIASQNYSE